MDAVGKDRPGRRVLSAELWRTLLSHSAVCLRGPGLEHRCGISPPGPQPIAMPVSTLA